MAKIKTFLFSSPCNSVAQVLWNGKLESKGQAYTTPNKFLVSKETLVLLRWESKRGKFGFIKRVDKGRITTVNDLES